MAIVITAPEQYDPHKHPGWTVFLAGAIDMGAAVDWQAYVIELLTNTAMVLFNPRRPGTDWPEEYQDEQIEWELNLLDKCDAIFMWLPSNAKAPISLFEAGLYWQSGKLCIGADLEFYRRRNLELTGKRYGVYIYKTLDDALTSLVSAHWGGK